MSAFSLSACSLIFAYPLSAEKPLALPGSEMCRGIFDPPFTKPTELPAESPLPKTLFQHLRPLNEKMAWRQVQFADSLRVFKNWALFTGMTEEATGNPRRIPPMG